MASDDLTRPLGLAPPEPAAGRGRPWLLPVASVAGGMVVLAALVWLTLSRDPLAGEPMAVARIERAPITVESVTAPPPPRAEAGDVAPPSREARTRQTARELEQDSGVRVMRPGGSSAPGSLVIRVPDTANAQRLAAANDKRLVERGKHGLLPKVGADGARPAEVYARPLTPQQRSAAVRVAIVVGGLGIGGQSTGDAIRKLPPSVSLAFAPYGAELERQATQAREDGHEVLVQAPMEPFDYPDNDPGPKTLLVAATPEQNQDRLHWMLGRVPGAIGVVNYMGGRFTATEPAIAPVVRELGGRGLLYLDDGSSGRSLAAQVASGVGTAGARADVVIDAVQRGPEIDQALARLESLARQNGHAIGFASALPVSVERIARWLRQAEARGVTLVPVSALAPLPRRS
jgi:polysaccharide deacetylase 2 family uncharacterized protein YibQ